MILTGRQGSMISHFDHIVLTVANIDRAVSFYETVLNMEPITFDKERKAMRFGKQKINLQLLGEELRNHAMEGAGDLCLITDWSMDDVVTHLKNCKVSILEGPVSKSGAQGPIQSVYFNDPDNNLIEVSVYSEEVDSDETRVESEGSDIEGINTEDDTVEDVITEDYAVENEDATSEGTSSEEVNFKEESAQDSTDSEVVTEEDNASIDNSETEDTKDQKPAG